MKPFVKYNKFISLLFIGRLILPFCIITALHHPDEKRIAPKTKTHNNYKKVQPNAFTGFNEIILALFPALKS